MEWLDSLDFNGTWENFKDRVYSVGADVLGFRIRKHKDWFDDNNIHINQLLETKHTLYEKLLNQNFEKQPAAEKSYKDHQLILQH